MNFTLSIRSLNPNERISIPNGKIADGITMKREHTIREILNPPVDFLVSIAQNYALPVAAALTAEYIIRYLKGKKDEKIEINNNTVNINPIEIEQLIINIYQSSEEKP